MGLMLVVMRIFEGVSLFGLVWGDNGCAIMII